MADVYLVHWDEAEARERARALESAGHRVRVHWSTERAARIDPLPDALVVSLDRLPSHGRSVAEWMVEAKKRRSVPVLFAGGTADKAEVARRQFPHAAFCATSDLVTALARLLAARRTSAALGRRVPGPPTRPTPRKPGR